MPALLSALFLAVTDAGLVLLLWTSLTERAKRASLLAACGLAFNTALWTGFWLLPRSPALRFMNGAAVGLLAALAVSAFLKEGAKREVPAAAGEIKPYDERDHMFSRNALKFHPGLSRRYYKLHPENKKADQAIHRKPEIGEEGHEYYHPLYSAACLAAFEYLDRSRPLAEGPVATRKSAATPEEVGRAVRRLARHYGASDVGFVRLKPHHIYSRRGRQAERWGRKVTLEQDTAVVLIVAMDQRMIRQAPSLSVILESSRKYVEAAKTAFVLAGYLRSLGYHARAHTDANYLTVCVPAAADAGLGEVGRMGILIHPRLGPCLRISMVTTDCRLPVERSSVFRRDFGIEAFCRICCKCADNCPARAIPFGDKPRSRGAAHWSIRQESCFSYWKTVGTDCGVCIRACPFTKPDTLLHRLARRYVSRNPFNRRLALALDDWLYGRKYPLPGANPLDLFPD